MGAGHVHDGWFIRKKLHDCFCAAGCIPSMAEKRHKSLTIFIRAGFLAQHSPVMSFARDERCDGDTVALARAACRSRSEREPAGLWRPVDSAELP
jgi:hypothetical protein